MSFYILETPFYKGLGRSASFDVTHQMIRLFIFLHKTLAKPIYLRWNITNSTEDDCSAIESIFITQTATPKYEYALQIVIQNMQSTSPGVPEVCALLMALNVDYLQGQSIILYH